MKKILKISSIDEKIVEEVVEVTDAEFAQLTSNNTDSTERIPSLEKRVSVLESALVELALKNIGGA
jgi:hypothetical protein